MRLPLNYRSSTKLVDLTMEKETYRFNEKFIYINHKIIHISTWNVFNQQILHYFKVMTLNAHFKSEIMKYTEAIWFFFFYEF